MCVYTFLRLVSSKSLSSMILSSFRCSWARHMIRPDMHHAPSFSCFKQRSSQMSLIPIIHHHPNVSSSFALFLLPQRRYWVLDLQGFHPPSPGSAHDRRHNEGSAAHASRLLLRVLRAGRVRRPRKPPDELDAAKKTAKERICHKHVCHLR